MVMKAIRKLGSEVEAVVFVPKHGVGTDDVWVAIEQNVCALSSNLW